ERGSLLTLNVYSRAPSPPLPDRTARARIALSIRQPTPHNPHIHMTEVPRYARLSSPALIGHAVNSAADKTDARMTALGMAGTLSEIVEAIPVTYREALKPFLRRFSDAVVKAVGVRNATAKLL